MVVRSPLKCIAHLCLACLGLLVSCAPADEPASATATALATTMPRATSAEVVSVKASAVVATDRTAPAAGIPVSTARAWATATTMQPAASSTPAPTTTLRPSPSPAHTPTPVLCAERHPDEGLLTLVTRDYGLSRDYEPADLVALADYFGPDVTLGYPTEVRTVIVQPLRMIIDAMREDGLRPQIISGFRSYSEQAVAFRKWLTEFPDWGSHLSAPPGHSEHQLGTTVDFGSPELKYMLGESYVQFHPAFAQTSEGKWLAERAMEYGFTMSYPDGKFEQTTFYYEPWHFRYVGRELAMALAREGITLTEYLQREQPTPCRVE